MSTTNTGDQTIWLSYKSQITASNFNKWFYPAIKPGLFSGGELSIVNTSGIVIAPFKAFIPTSQDHVVHVETASNVTVYVSEPSDIVTASFSYVASETNYADFQAKEYASGILSNEIVFGDIIYSGGVPSGVVYTHRSRNLIDSDYDVYAKEKIYFSDAADVYVGKATHKSSGFIEVGGPVILSGFVALANQTVENVGTFTASHKIKVEINGTNYYISLDQE